MTGTDANKSPAGHWRFLAEKARRLPLYGSSDAWLMEMLQRNAGTYVGRKYKFSQITCAADFQNSVPVHDYEAVAPLIERTANGENDVLFAGRAVSFEYTGGSTGLNNSGTARAAKLIPYSRESLKDFRNALLPWLGSIVESCKFSGRAYWSVSPALRRPSATSAGIPIGLADWLYLGADTEEAFTGLSAVPFWVGTLEDVELWRAATLYYLVRASDLSFIFIWSPSFFSQLIRGIAENGQRLMYFLKNGGTLHGRKLPRDIRAAGRLETYLENRDTRALWPGPLAISAWTDARAAGFAEELAAMMPQARILPKGLLCTEGVVSVPDKAGRALVMEGHGFLEFMDDQGRAHVGQALTPGVTYRVIMTTGGGLYRYFTGDIVLCTAHAAGMAAVCFVGRSGLCSDLAGEKLTDAFVASCLGGIKGFALLQPVRSGRAGYRLLLDSAHYSPADAEESARKVEEALGQNPQYAYAGRMRQLEAVEVLLIREPAEQYLAWAVSAMQGRRSVLKIPALCANDGFQPI